MADNYQIDLTLEEIFGTGIVSIEQTASSNIPGGANVWTVTLTNGSTYDFTVLNGTSGGDPVPVRLASEMTDPSAVYLYLGSETGYSFGHWYYYTDAWTDGGGYGEKGDTGDDGFSPIVTVSKSGTTTTISVTDANGTTTSTVEDGVAPEEMIAQKTSDWLAANITTPTGVAIDKSLSISGAAADAKVTGDEISQLKSVFDFSKIYQLTSTSNVSRQFQFHFYEGIKYTVVNNTSANITFQTRETQSGSAVQELGTIYSGASKSFVCTTETYWFNSWSPNTGSIAIYRSDPSIDVLRSEFREVAENSQYILTGYYVNGSNVITKEAPNYYSYIIVIPVKQSHQYKVLLNGCNRLKVCLGDELVPSDGYAVTLLQSKAPSTREVVIFTNTTHKYAYIYCFNSNTAVPNVTYEVQDLTACDGSAVNTFKGIYVGTSTINTGADTEMKSFPVMPNATYELTVFGGNRRNIGFGSSCVPVIGSSSNILTYGASEEETHYSINTGEYTYLYVYYYTDEASAEHEAVFSLVRTSVSDDFEKVYKYTDYHSGVSISNVGTRLVVGEYNLAKYNNDTAVYISAEKLHNVKEIITDLGADVFFAVEDTGYIDSGKTKSSHDYVFRPVYPFVTGSTNEKLYSKYPFVTAQNKNAPSSNRPVTFATISVNNKTILLVLVHTNPGILETDIPKRAAEFSWMVSEIANITHDYCIMAGDFNPEAGEEDLANMESIFGEADMIMCNGGYFDYLNTWFDPAHKYSNVIARKMPLDYVITSPNVICNNFKVYSDKFYDLYSDHVPTVADLTLLD